MRPNDVGVAVGCRQAVSGLRRTYVLLPPGPGRWRGRLWQGALSLRRYAAPSFPLQTSGACEHRAAPFVTSFGETRHTATPLAGHGLRVPAHVT
jgi:hypothetical protein